MGETVISAVAIILSSGITGLVTLRVCTKNNEAHNKSTIELIVYKLEELTKHVEKHNQVIDRTYKLEQDVAVIQTLIHKED